MKIIIAPNSFKGSLNAFDVAEAIQKGINRSRLQAETFLFPIADGGDHTVDVLNTYYKGQMIHVPVVGPLGQTIEAAYSIIHGDTAVIEMAKSSGIDLVEIAQLNPLKATSFGTGQLIKNALERGVRKIILGLGGSATVDAGTGLLQALGARLYDHNDKIIGVDANPLIDLASFDLSKIDSRLANTELLVLCDVENPLLGPQGCALVFGPQKGADAGMVMLLDQKLSLYNDLITEHVGRDFGYEPHGGAAGGIAMTLMSLFNAQVLPGVDYILSEMGFEKAIEGCEVLITAEGKVDSQTLSGKGPHGVALKAKKQGALTAIMAGKAEDVDDLNSVFDVVLPITNGPCSLKEAMDATAHDLEVMACQLGNLLARQR